MSQNRSHAVMAQRHEAADSLDLFPTPGWATRALCEQLTALGYDLRMAAVWEPACGLGHMSRVLPEYFGATFSSDAADHGYGDIMDFLFADMAGDFDWIVTNPPFRLSAQFATHALKQARMGVALLVRSSFLEGISRWRQIYDVDPPSHVFQFVERVPMCKGRVDPELSTATSYSWLVWTPPRGRKDTILRWIPPCRKRLERPEDYAEAAA